MWNSFKIAFSMYSKIPMPKSDWSKKNMRYTLCFFPMVGIAVGFIIYLWYMINNCFEINDILRTSIYVVIPIIVTGGIHIDGLVDTMDAINSYQTRERKLEILKDSHIGAFALIGALTYFILSFGLWSEISEIKEILIIAIGYVFSRSLSGFSIANFKCAKNSGLVATFSDAAAKKTATVFMIIYIIICIICMLAIDIKYGITAVICVLLSFIYYRIMSYKKFGGITGDLAGFFLQISELSIVFGIVILKLFMR